MKSVLLGLILLNVPLQAPFVVAEASALQVDGDRLWVEVRVETTRAAATVLVRALGPDDRALEPVAMAQSDSRWTARVFLPRRSDIRLSFEHIDAEGFSFVSRPVALIELGVDAAVFGLDSGTATGPSADSDIEPPAGRDRSRWLWLAMGFGAALGALLLVVFGRGAARDVESEI